MKKEDKKKTNPWRTFLMDYKAKHKDKSFPECMTEAAILWKKQKK
jgi:hypothetical protein